MIMICSCGKPISRHMHGKCFACRYEEMKKIKIKAPVKCKFCGKEFFPLNGRRYCTLNCQREREKEAMRIKANALITKSCSVCGAEFQVKRSSTRTLCMDCKNMTKRSYKPEPKPTVDYKARAEKMLKIKASGMTYGQYMANKGIKPEKPEAYSGTLSETQSWMTGPGKIEVHPELPHDPPRAMLKRRVN